MDVQRVREGKLRGLPPSVNTIRIEPGICQQENDQSYSSRFQDSDDHPSRLSKAWVRVETNSSLKLEQFPTHSCPDKKVENKFSSSPAPTPTPMEGWICVERPGPITSWEDSSKQSPKKAKESITNHHIPPNLSFSPPPLSAGNPPLPNDASFLAPSQTLARVESKQPQMPSGRGAELLYPIPLPPKLSPRRLGRIPSGNVKARINAFESNLDQDPDQSVPNLDNENLTRSETRPLRNGLKSQDKSISEENLRKWEEKVRNWGKSSEEDSEVQEEWNSSKVPVNISSREDLSKDSMETLRLQRPGSAGCESNKIDMLATAADERYGDFEATENLMTPGESWRGICKAYSRLPQLEVINMVASEADPNEFVPRVEGRTLPLQKERGHLHEDVKSQGSFTPLHGRETTENLIVTKGIQGFGVQATPPGVVAKSVTTVKNEVIVSEYFTNKGPPQSQDSTNLRFPPTSNLLPSPKPAASALQSLVSLSGESLQGWKCQKFSKTKARKSILPCSLKEFKQKNKSGERLTSKGIDDYSATVEQADKVPQDYPSNLLDHLQSPQICVSTPCEETTKNGETEISRSEIDASHTLFQMGSVVKQVLGGAVILVGLFAFWPRAVGPVERYHVVKAGETLSSIAPGQCNDPSSKFCRNNPQICDQRTIYPGQRLRLP